MTVQEFSNEFDILYNNIMSNQAPGLDEYEKSVFLTQAQEDVIRACYQGTSAGLGPFENTELVRRELSNLIKISNIDTYETVSTQFGEGKAYTLPPEAMYIIQEYYTDSNENPISVVPVTYDEIQKIKSNPFRGPSKNRILRLDYGENKVILIVDKNLVETYAGSNPEYVVSYVRKPYPIILTDLSDSGLTINNQDSPLDDDNPCELSSSIHRLILTQAVQLAAAAYKS